MHKLTPKINGTCIKWININGAIPVKSEGNIWILVGWFYRVVVSSLMIIPTNRALLAHTPAVAAIIPVWDNIKPITKTYFLPIAVSYALVFPNIGRTSPATIILHTTVYIIWKLIIYIDMIKLRYWYIANKAPGFSSISGNIHATIITIYHKISVGWMYPPGVMIWMYSVIHTIGRHKLFKVFTSIFTYINIGKHRIHSIFILRVYKYITVIKRSVSNIAFIIGLCPGKSCVCTFIQRIFFGLYQGVYYIWFVWGYGKANAP